VGYVRFVMGVVAAFMLNHVTGLSKRLAANVTSVRHFPSVHTRMYLATHIYGVS